MPRPSLSESQYRSAASEKDLELVGYSPLSVYDVATWRCLRCGKEMRKTYRAVKYGRVGCRCQSHKMRLPENSYIELAEKLGIEWIGKDIPLNVRQNTLWRGRTGIEVIMPYRLIAYGLLSRESRQMLGLPEDYYEQLKDA